jgi:lysophospholipase L1-like esterase
MNYLALGDSYTIGELVPFEENLPSHIQQMLNAREVPTTLDQVIAVTGWTTDELAEAIEKADLKPNYDLVTLLIGVNNQYRNRSVEEYRWQFYSLLCQAILFAKGNPASVWVFSIPDWGVTPFNTQRDRAQVTTEIDAFNRVNQEITARMGCNYVPITELSREQAKDLRYLASDQLHYSGEAYRVWAEKMTSRFLEKK